MVKVDSWDYIEGGLHYPIMQFTGLTDKKDKEIWEGDVVRIKDEGTWEPMHLEHETDLRKNGCLCKGKFTVATVGFEWGTYTYMHDEEQWVDVGLFNDTKYIEVIGNIYENPELLK